MASTSLWRARGVDERWGTRGGCDTRHKYNRGLREWGLASVAYFADEKRRDYCMLSTCCGDVYLYCFELHRDVCCDTDILKDKYLEQYTSPLNVFDP